ncbi:MAG: RDD family protein [Halomonas sp.]|nr:RDD family protein [Halomonas sp.]MDN6296607.1 RDD family protein [Halomonas sp.]MDN6314204.1 RDD family protein [Halomonas sp.]MDN6335113.1 RDD family protein [Halomonas sp.]
MTQRRFTQLDSVTPAALPRRLAAMFYDGFLVLAIWLVVTVAHLAFMRFVLGYSAESVGAGNLAVATLRLLLVCSAAAFFAYCWRRGGMTLGMQAWRLRVQTLDGSPISLFQSLVRCLTAWVSLAALGLGYWWVLFDAEKRSWPDIASGTRTVVLPKDELKKAVLAKEREKHRPGGK